MSNSPMIPMFSPDGALGYVPVERLNDAKSAGGKVAIKMQAPNGKDVGYVPADKANDAAKAGGKALPYDAEEANGGQKEGFWNAYGHDLAGLLLPSAPSPYPGMDLEYKQQIAQASADADAKRKAQGAGLAYRVAAGLATPVANVEGMEQAAEKGDTAGVLGHAAAGATVAASPIIAEGAGRGISKALPTGEAAAFSLYKSALKPSTTIPDWKVQNIVKTGIAEGIPVSAAGSEKLGNLIDSINNDISEKIKAGAGAGVTVNKFAAASKLGDTAQTFANQVTPAKDLATIAKTGNEFLRNQPNEIPADTAQAMKQGTYQQIAKSYGKLSSASIESQKALARGIKDELASQIPEIGDLNARESKLLDLDKSLERAVNRIGNHQMMGIGTPLAASGIKAATGSTGLSAVAGVLKAVIDDPIIKSKLAIAMGRKGVPVSQANARLAKYSALLSNAASNVPRAGQNSTQGDEQ